MPLPWSGREDTGSGGGGGGGGGGVEGGIEGGIEREEAVNTTSFFITSPPLLFLLLLVLLPDLVVEGVGELKVTLPVAMGTQLLPVHTHVREGEE